MHLKKIVFNNFRCFDHIDIELHPRLTVLVAENGGGKTSILDGIAIGLAPLARSLSTADQRLKTPSFSDTDFSLVPYRYAGEDKWGSSDFTQVILTTTDGMRWDNWKPATAGKKPDEKIGQSDLYSYTQDLLNRLKQEPPPLLPIFAYYGAQRGHIQIPKRLWEAEDNSEQRTSALVGALSAYNDFKHLLKWFDTEQSAELVANKGNLLEDFVDFPSLIAVRNTIISLLGGQYDNPHFNARHKFVVNPKNGIGELQITQLSQGYQSMLAMGMDIARRLAVSNSHLDYVDNAFNWSFATNYLQQNHPDGLPNAPVLGSCWAPAIVLIDEIDLHLHPSWQQRVLTDLMRAFPGTQFIVTTHSPQVLTTVKRENIRVLGRNALAKWEALPPAQEIKGVQSGVALNDVMGVNPIPPVDEARWLSDYTALIENGKHEEPEGKALREKLLSLYGVGHSVMLDADRLIRFQAFKLRKTSPNQA